MASLPGIVLQWQAHCCCFRQAAGCFVCTKLYARWSDPVPLNLALTCVGVLPPTVVWC